MTTALPWLVRLVWIIQPLGIGASLGAALAERSEPVALVIEAVAWLGWAVGLVAVLTPRTLGLTALRMVAPGSLALAVWSALAHDETLTGAIAVLAASVATVVALAPATGDLFVNGSAYGDERRFALRPPAAVVFGPVVLLWALIAAAMVTGPLLLAVGRWAAGAVALLVGAAVVVVGTRSLHQLSRRWLVMVPAGVVIHDPTAVSSHLIRRSTIASLGPAPADSGALDLTGGALGLALEIQLSDTQDIELRQRGNPNKLIHTRAVMFTPSRPGAVLQEAKARRIPVGSPLNKQ